MSRGIYVALSGAVAQQTSLDETAQNLANAQTTGFQRTKTVFRQVLAQARGETRFGAAGETVLDRTRGTLRTTGRGLDVALGDDSYLAVNTARGERYTRAGSLAMSPDGTLRTSSGHALLDEVSKKPIVCDPTKGEPTIDPSGEVTQAGESIARVRVVSFQDPSRLAHEEASVVAATPASGNAKPANSTLQVGVLEESNANVTTAMNEIVNASRMFEAFQNAIQTFGDADKKLVQTVPNGGNGG